MNTWRRHALGLALAALASSAVPAADTAWWDPRGDRSALAALGDLDGASAVAVGADGAIAVAAFARGKRGDLSTLRVAGAGTAPVETLDLPGEVRAMRFTDGDRELLVILAKRSKRRPPETQLFSIELDSLRARRCLGLPHSAHALTFWPERSALVVAARDEIRTFLLPEYNSGPLFRVPGDHRSLEPIEGSLFALATGEQVTVVDLTDDPTEDGLPVRAALDAGTIIEEIAVLPESPRIAVRRQGADPVRLTLPEAAFVEPAPRTPDPESEPEPEPVTNVATASEDTPAVTEAAVAAAAAPIVAEVRDEVASTGPESPTPDAAVATETVQTSPDVTVDEAPEAVSPAETTVPAEPAAAEPPAVGADPDPSLEADTGAAIRGRIGGEGVEFVLSVVVYGPDNMLREADRVAPRSDGSYAFPDLAPGSYRIVLDGGGDRLIQSEPPFQVVRVGEEGVTAKPFTILRVR